MQTREQLDTSFVLIDADWSPARGLEVLRTLRPRNVIVHRRDEEKDPEYYYLLRLDEALERLEHGEQMENLKDTLDLHEYEAAPTVEVSEDVATAPARAVVTDHGRVLGFIDTGVRQTRAFPKAIDPLPTAEAPSGGEGDEVDRTIVAKMPEKVAQNDVASLRVLLSAVAQAGEGIPITMQLGTEVDVVVEARRGFAIEGSESGTLKVTEEQEGLPLLFKLKATDLGTGLVVVFAFHQGYPLGKISLSPTVIEAPPADAAEKQVIRTVEAPLAPPVVHVPDLDLLIQEWPVGPEHQYSILLTAADSNLGIRYKKFGPLKLQMDPVRYFADFFDEIDNLALDTAADRDVAATKLAVRGTGLFNALFSPELRTLLWSLKDSIKSIWVQSEEPWIPWELCKLESETHEPGPFLSEAFSITRWVPGQRTTPTLSLNNVGVVVPSDSGLPSAQTERDFLLSQAGNGRQVSSIEATWAGVYDALRSAQYDCLHFTGHGAARAENPDRARIILEQGSEFVPADVSGEAAKLGGAHPLVFLNACQVGQGGMSLTGIGGWANRFLEAGAGAFIGTYWSVFDEPAAKFMEALYPALIGGTSIGEAVKNARAAIKPLGDPTWLAYTVFADPLASV
jgi:hypothetical protein